MSVNKVLVYVQKSPLSVPILGSFSDCIVNLISNDDSLDTRVTCELRENKLVLSPASQSNIETPAGHQPKLAGHLLTQPKLAGHLLTHPSFCPVHHLTPADTALLPASVAGRGVDVGVVTVLESLDERVLLTRRAKHMRTFPGVWVPPGGHIEVGEDLLEAALRELGEETGLMVRVSEWHVLCLWESVFPHRLSLGQPQRHHIVVYLHVMVQELSNIMDSRISLDKTEVDGCVWIDKQVVAAMQNNSGLPQEKYSQVKALDKEEKYMDKEEKYMPMKALDAEGLMVESVIPVSVFTASAPTHGQDIQRVSTGTKYACLQWLNYCKQKHSCISHK